MEWLLIVAGGLLGSAHCVGMCGGFVLSLGSQAPSWRRGAAWQLVYAAGRIFTYAFLGALAGFAGWRLHQTAISQAQAGLAWLAGGMLILEGLFSLGWLRRPTVFSAQCPGAGAFAMLLRSRDLLGVFLAGLANGFIPCGLVYAYLALAANSAHIVLGGFTMLLFGLGTIPALVVLGTFGSIVAPSLRRRVFQVAALCMIATGALTVQRGIHAWQAPEGEPPCPYCDPVVGERGT